MLKFDLKDFDKTVRKLSDVKETKDLMNKISRDMKMETDLRFRNQVDPEGVRWKPLKYRKGQALSNTGKLRRSIHSGFDRHRAYIGTNNRYAKRHNFGDDKPIIIKPKKGKYLTFKVNGQWVRKKNIKVRIPQRQFMGFGKKQINKYVHWIHLWATGEEF